MKVLPVVLIIAGVVAITVILLTLPSPQYSCPEDAKVCPDGSTVGRYGPSCEFTPCPSVLPPGIESYLNTSDLNAGTNPRACKSDSDCILVTSGCCRRDCPDAAIHNDYRNSFIASKNAFCSITTNQANCPTGSGPSTCAPSRAICENGLCTRS